MEDLPLGRIAALVPQFAVKDLPLGRILMMMMRKNLMRMEHFDICILKLYKKLISQTDSTEILCTLFSKSRIYSIKIIKFWKLIWQFQNSAYSVHESMGGSPGDVNEEPVT